MNIHTQNALPAFRLIPTAMLKLHSYVISSLSCHEVRQAEVIQTPPLSHVCCCCIQSHLTINTHELSKKEGHEPVRGVVALAPHRCPSRRLFWAQRPPCWAAVMPSTRSGPERICGSAKPRSTKTPRTSTTGPRPLQPPLQLCSTSESSCVSRLAFGECQSPVLRCGDRRAPFKARTPAAAAELGGLIHEMKKTRMRAWLAAEGAPCQQDSP